MQLTYDILRTYLVLLLLTHASWSQERRNKRKRVNKWSLLREMQGNLTELWKEVKALSNPVRVHVQGSDNFSFGDQGCNDMHRDRNGFFEETYDHKDEPPMKSSRETNFEAKGTQVHIHFNMPKMTSSCVSSPIEGVMHHGNEHSSPTGKGYTYAKCDIKSQGKRSDTHHLDGYIMMRQKPSNPLEVQVYLTGFQVKLRARDGDIGDNDDAHSLHGIHVHKYGDLSRGCASFGGHFNPGNSTHGGRGSHKRHAGDWGNLRVSMQGMVLTEFTDNHSTLFGSNTILGRGIVIHEDDDDLGQGATKASHTTGDAGGRLACCVIAANNGDLWDNLVFERE